MRRPCAWAVYSLLILASIASARQLAGQSAGQPPGQQPTAQPSAQPDPAPRWFDKINLAGMLAGDLRWIRTGVGTTAATTSDLYLRALELGLEVDFVDWATATVVLISEWIGDPLNGGDSGIVVDEAHVDISVPRSPVYFVLGKRDQPFGLFESNMVTDPLVHDAYETKVVGLTAGVTAPLSTDLSVTVYKGRVQSDQLMRSMLFDPAAAPYPDITVNRLDSWIVSASSEPVGKGWTVFAAFASEPGAGRRMTALNIATHLALPSLKHVQLDAEYMRALKREDVPGLGRPFRESALSATLSYQLISSKKPLVIGGNYRARKSHRMAHPAELNVRFEIFDDGSRAATLGSWSVKNRASIGGHYTFFQQGSVLAAVDVEYRRQTLRVSPLYDGTAASGHEVYLRLGLDF